MTKIKAVLRSSEKQSLDILDGSITITTYKSEEHKPYLQELFKSIAARQLLQISYEKADGTASERKVEPIGCYHQSNKWYLVAYCQREKDYRTFMMNRIQSLVALNEHYKRNQISLQQYLEQQAIAKKDLKGTNVVEVIFHNAIIEHANRRKYYFGLIEETKQSDGALMKFWTPSIELMARWLIPFTNQALVMNPPVLRDRIKELSKELYDHYK